MFKFKWQLALIIAIVISITGCGVQQTETSQASTQIQTTTITTQATTDEIEAVSEGDYGIEIGLETVTFIDARGETVEISKNPERVVCLYNSYLDIWDSCGGTVVGRVEASEDVPVESAASAEVVGTVGTPSLERILALEPELVILTHGLSVQAGLIPALEQSGIEVIAIKNDYLEDYYRTVRLFTAVLDREDLYQNLMETVRNEVETVVESVPKDEIYSVLIVYATSKSLTVRTSESMVGEMLADLNTVNISDSALNGEDAKIFSMEKILEEDPDFIFVQTMGSDMAEIEARLKSDAESNPAWAALTAVESGRYIVLPKDLYLYKPNARYGEAYRGLAEILYPETFNR